MFERYDDLAPYGWDEWFENQADLYAEPDDTFARVAAVDRDQLLLVDRAGQFRAKLSGSFLHRHTEAHERPCVGDWVCVTRPETDGPGLITALLERKTELRRRSAGDCVGYQMIAANVDHAVIVQSCHYDFNVNRLARYLVMVRDGGAEPVVLLTKTDLVEPAVLASQLAEIHNAGITAPVHTLSNVTKEGLNSLRQMMLPGRTYCFVGSSGVGKSTLINRLLGREVLGTKGVSVSGEGRHKTVRRELLVLEGGALVIDNPGMREFGVLDAGSGIGDSFTGILELGADCRYRDCTHTTEPGCAVIEALESGRISREHYDNYRKLKDESDFYQLSYAEKRKKDRDFGKFIKSAKKDLE